MLEGSETESFVWFRTRKNAVLDLTSFSCCYEPVNILVSVCTLICLSHLKKELYIFICFHFHFLFLFENL